MNKAVHILLLLGLALGMSVSATALEDVTLQNQEGHLIVDLETSQEPDSIEVITDSQIGENTVATEDDFTGLDTQPTTEIPVDDIGAGLVNVEVITEIGGEEENYVQDIQLLNQYIYGEDVEVTLEVNKDESEMANNKGLQQADGSSDPYTVVEAYSKIVLLEGNAEENPENAEIIWEGTPSLLPSGNPWDRVHHDGYGTVVDEYTFSNSFYSEGEYSYVMYLASAETSYDQVEEDWVAPEPEAEDHEEITEQGDTYLIREEDRAVYPFEVVEPEEPPSAFEELTAFFDGMTNALFNAFR